jgi:hypothetical protein
VIMTIIVRSLIQMQFNQFQMNLHETMWTSLKKIEIQLSWMGSKTGLLKNMCCVIELLDALMASLS